MNTHSSSQQEPQSMECVGTGAAPVATRSTSRKLGLKSVEVLLIEDDEADAYLIEQALARIPCIRRVVRARDGVEALSLIDARESRPNLALVDLQMPRKDGLQLLSELQSRPFVNFRSVVLTSSHSFGDLHRAARLGAWKYLTKKASVAGMQRSLIRTIVQL